MDSNHRPPQIPNAPESFDFCESELVIGVVCAVGADYGPVRDSVIEILREYAYTSQVVRISDLISRFVDASLPSEPEILRMSAGNSVCRATKRKDFWALAAAAEIMQPGADHPALILNGERHISSCR